MPNIPQVNIEALAQMAEVCDRSQVRRHALLLKQAVAEIKAMRHLLALAKAGA